MQQLDNVLWAISIHALREEGDGRSRPIRPLIIDFYPRPPRGGRPSAAGQHAEPDKFLSTPSARRATRAGHIAAHFGNISIHALREEGDLRAGRSAAEAAEFLSTPSARRATPVLPEQSIRYEISIHALREEGDRITR